MELNALTAISPVDGRYGSKTQRGSRPILCAGNPVRPR